MMFVWISLGALLISLAASGDAAALIPRQNGVGPSLGKCNLSYPWLYYPSGSDPCAVFNIIAENCPQNPQLSGLPDNITYAAVDPMYADQCSCNLASYTLLAACAYCQGHNWIDLNDYKAACNATFSYAASINSSLASNHLPPWALSNTTLSANSSWTPASAEQIAIAQGFVSNTTTSSSSATSMTSAAASSSSNSTPAPTNGTVTHPGGVSAAPTSTGTSSAAAATTSKPDGAGKLSLGEGARWLGTGLTIAVIGVCGMII